jgi:hypothetical protein
MLNKFIFIIFFVKDKTTIQQRIWRKKVKRIFRTIVFRMNKNENKKSITDQDVKKDASGLV